METRKVNDSIVPIELPSASYQIVIGTNNLSELATQISKHSPTRIFVLYDENVEVHLDEVLKSFDQSGISQSENGDEQKTTIEVIKIASGEQSKCIDTSNRLWEFLAERRADRQSIIVALGGGVVGDLAGFIAATYARGIRFFQVPTTLLAHVDSSVGGKTGINLSSAKNMVGSFWQPVGVLIDTHTLTTLDQREYVSGLAEVIKYGLIMDAGFFELLENNVEGLTSRDDELLTKVISHCCKLKGQVVEEDEKEISGRRAILNYGHTFAHAFETVFGYGEYLHGEAVGVGMLCAGELAKKMGWVSGEFCDRQYQLIEQVGLPTSVKSAGVDELVQVMKRDKKNVDDVIRFILPKAMGQVELVTEPVSRDWICESIQAFME